MKCLRCGKEMNNDEECTCGHFYDTNLNKGKKLSPGKMIKKNTDFYSIIIGLVSLVFIVGIFLINYLPSGPERNEFCEKVCEGESYVFRSNKNTCICKNGKEYKVE